MKLTYYENITPHKKITRTLTQRMLSPLCGMIQEIGYVARTQGDMRLLTGSAALTGVHQLFNRPNPGRGAYHIGGTGIIPDESSIRLLGETVERYAQLLSEFSHSSLVQHASWEKIHASGSAVVPAQTLSPHSPEQLAQPGFPFDQASPHDSLGWIRMQDIASAKPVQVPAQMVLVGYNIRNDLNEPWITSAVTTGTAAHINYQRAFRAALLELIQLDSVMGHWYSAWRAIEIQPDDRVAPLLSLMKKYHGGGRHYCKFYLIPNPDLAGFTVACLWLQDRGLPKVVIGLGADTTLLHAMYRAFLETVASVGLARMVVFREHQERNPPDIPNTRAFYDLDSNVGYYASGANFSRIQDRFLSAPAIPASDLPADLPDDPELALTLLVRSFIDNNKQLCCLDLSNIEATTLGFRVVRVWSPDTLSLCLPSAPQTKHPRFHDYGGIQHADPHPYP